MLQPAGSTDVDVGHDYAIGTNNRAATKLRSGIDNCGGVNLDIAHLSRNVNMRSPSETTASLTTQLQCAFASRLLRALISSAWMKSVSPGKTGLRNFTSSALMK